MNVTATPISQVQLMMIPSTDQDRSIAFYETLGFEKRRDSAFGDGYRWVELYPPSGTTGIVPIVPGADDPTGIQTGIILNTDDIGTTHAQMRSLGVDADAQIARAGSPAKIRLGAAQLSSPVPPMFWTGPQAAWTIEASVI